MNKRWKLGAGVLVVFAVLLYGAMEISHRSKEDEAVLVEPNRVTIDGTFNYGSHAPFERIITRPELVLELYREILELPPVPKRLNSTPNDGCAYDLIFAHDSHELLFADVEASGSQLVSITNNTEKQWAGGRDAASFWATFGQAMGVSVSRLHSSSSVRFEGRICSEPL